MAILEFVAHNRAASRSFKYYELFCISNDALSASRPLFVMLPCRFGLLSYCSCSGVMITASCLRGGQSEALLLLVPAWISWFQAFFEFVA